MAFWGVEVKPGKHFTLKATDATEIKRLHLSQATLGIGNATTTRSILQCIVGNKSPLFLCGLSPQKVDSCQLNIEFEETEDVIFSVLGPLSVHLTGYFLGRGSSTAFRLHDDESESFGEDIVDTDVEKGSSDDYDYSDSFINDDDPSARSSHISSTDDDEISIKERAAKKEKKKSKKGGRLMKKKFQVPDSESDANEDSVEKIPKVLSSEVRENGDKCEKKTSEATDKTLDKSKDKPSGSVESSPIKKKRNKESDVDDEEGKNMPATDKAIESSNKKRKKDRKEETRARKKQALDKNTDVGTEKLPEPDKSSDEVTIEEITKGNVDGKVAAQGKKVSILYTAKLKDTGKFIESNSKEAPLRFRIGGEKVIKGLSIGVEGMRVGDKRRLIIPPSLGYSEEGLKKEDVPKNAWLVYEVEAVKVR